MFIPTAIWMPVDNVPRLRCVELHCNRLASVLMLETQERHKNALTAQPFCQHHATIVRNNETVALKADIEFELAPREEL